MKITRFDAGKTGQVAFDAPGLGTTDARRTQADGHNAMAALDGSFPALEHLQISVLTPRIIGLECQPWTF
jgi:hypothetical protein